MKFGAKVTYVIFEYFEVDAENEGQAKEIAEELSRDCSLNDFIEKECIVEVEKA